MISVVQAPRDLVEDIANLRLPHNLDQRLQELMDRNNDGRLTQAERQDMADLVEWSEDISLLRAKALHLLGRTP
jgi:hypothetical protein